MGGLADVIVPTHRPGAAAAVVEHEPEPEPDDDDLLADNHKLQLQLRNIREKYQIQLQVSTIQRLYHRKATRWMQLYKAATVLLSRALLSELQASEQFNRI